MVKSSSTSDCPIFATRNWRDCGGVPVRSAGGTKSAHHPTDGGAACGGVKRRRQVDCSASDGCHVSARMAHGMVELWLAQGHHFEMESAKTATGVEGRRVDGY